MGQEVSSYTTKLISFALRHYVLGNNVLSYLDADTPKRVYIIRFFLKGSCWQRRFLGRTTGGSADVLFGTLWGCTRKARQMNFLVLVDHYVLLICSVFNVAQWNVYS